MLDGNAKRFLIYIRFWIFLLLLFDVYDWFNVSSVSSSFLIVSSLISWKMLEGDAGRGKFIGNQGKGWLDIKNLLNKVDFLWHNKWSSQKFKLIRKASINHPNLSQSCKLIKIQIQKNYCLASVELRHLNIMKSYLIQHIILCYFLIIGWNQNQYASIYWVIRSKICWDITCWSWFAFISLREYKFIENYLAFFIDWNYQIWMRTREDFHVILCWNYRFQLSDDIGGILLGIAIEERMN